MKRTVYLDFADFGFNFSKTNNYFYRLLSQRFDIQLCDQPDFLIYNDYGHSHRLHNGIKIYYTHESTRPNFNECDFAFTTHYIDDPRHVRLPYYAVIHPDVDLLIKQPGEAERLLAAKSKFCAFVVSSHNPRKNRNRLEFFQKLSKYKRVDSGGRFMNNIGGPLPGWSEGKVKWLRDYKFNIAFENESIQGYTTEKIVHPMLARCLPVYWGNPRITEEFNAASFLNWHEYGSDESLIEKIIELDGNDEAYLRCAAEPYLPNNQPTVWFDRQRLLDQFERIFASEGPSITQQRRKRRLISLGRWVLVKRYHYRPPIGTMGGI
jgi:alpha(1,3/1,4) fucosyltransferase